MTKTEKPVPVESGLFLGIPVLFGLSGTTALIFEIVWSRQFQLFLGSTIQTSSTVFAVFLGGYALGSYCTGRRSRGIEKRLLTAAKLEFGIGLYALCLSFFFRWFNTDIFVVLPDYIRPLFCILLLLPPALFFGALWPLLYGHYILVKEQLGLKAGNLYAFNSIGSGLGAFSAGFILIPVLGLFKATIAASCVNFLIGLIFIRLQLKNNVH